MHRTVFLILLISFLFGCSDQAEHYMNTELAARYFREVKEICDKDQGSLWGKNLYGPLMMIEHDSRRVFANTPDAEGLLKKREDVYTGVFPKEKMVRIIAREYGGTMYGLVPLPREEDPELIRHRSFHALFHVLQKEESFDSPRYHNNHINESPARIWLKMEWEALEKALKSTGGRREQALRDALVFRKYRRILYPKQANDENRFESEEGLAMFTASSMLYSREKAIDEAIELLHRIRDFRVFEHAFGFTSGDLYGHLIAAKTDSLQILKKPEIDLGEVAAMIYNIEMPSIINEDITTSLTAGYNYDEIRQEEMERLKRFKSRYNRLISTYTEKPVFFLELESPNFGFDLQDPIPLDTLGSLYQEIKITDNWGKLSVNDGGCLISSDLKTLRIPVKEDMKTGKNLLSGEGWELHLKNEYEVVHLDENYYLKKRYP